MPKQDHEIILFYKYVEIPDPEVLKNEQASLCKQLKLTGRAIIAKEGINATFEGTKEKIEAYLKKFLADPRFKNTHIKRSPGTGSAFPRLSIKVRPELVSLGLGEDDINPNEITGTHLKPEELHRWFEKNEDFVIVDMRNDYEHKSGHFKNSVLPKLENFRDLKKEVKNLEKLKDKKILTVCTGGVRCEKASGFLKKEGFQDVYQLDGGIVSYMEKYPNQNFLGKLYVFDNRKVMSFEANSPEHKVISNCEKCGVASDYYVNCANLMCHKHFIACPKCEDERGNVFCSKLCSLKVTFPGLTRLLTGQGAKVQK